MRWAWPHGRPIKRHAGRPGWVKNRHNCCAGSVNPLRAPLLRTDHCTMFLRIRSAAALAAGTVLAAGAVTVSPAPAQGLDATVWDRLAMCEAGGNWAINISNGYYGGLQFSATTWKYFGGTAYATRADLAPKAVQIYFGTKVQAVQGWNAWPGCKLKLGLTGTPPAVPVPPKPAVPLGTVSVAVLNQTLRPHVIIPVKATTALTRTSFALKAGVTYRLVAKGTYKWSTGTTASADAICAFVNGRWVRRPWADQQGNLLNLRVGTRSGGWKSRSGTACDAGRVYVWDYTPAATGAVELSVIDPNLRNNSGGVEVHVLKAGASVRSI